MQPCKVELEVKQRQEQTKGMPQLLFEFEEQMERELYEQDDQVSLSSTEVEEHLRAYRGLIAASEEDTKEDSIPISWKTECKLLLCDDWIMPVEIIRKPCSLQNPQDKLRARVAKNFLLVTLMSLNAGYGPLIESHQQHAEGEGLHLPTVNSITLTDDQVQLKEQEQREDVKCVPAGLALETLLARHLHEVKTSNSAVAVVNLKLYHVMSVKQSLREDLAEHSYQFSCRAADWPACPLVKPQCSLNRWSCMLLMRWDSKMYLSTSNNPQFGPQKHSLKM